MRKPELPERFLLCESFKEMAEEQVERAKILAEEEKEDLEIMKDLEMAHERMLSNWLDDMYRLDEEFDDLMEEMTDQDLLWQENMENDPILEAVEDMCANPRGCYSCGFRDNCCAGILP